MVPPVLVTVKAGAVPSPGIAPINRIPPLVASRVPVLVIEGLSVGTTWPSSSVTKKRVLPEAFALTVALFVMAALMSPKPLMPPPRLFTSVPPPVVKSCAWLPPEVIVRVPVPLSVQFELNASVAGEVIAPWIVKEPLSVNEEPAISRVTGCDATPPELLSSIVSAAVPSRSSVLTVVIPGTANSTGKPLITAS